MIENRKEERRKLDEYIEIDRRLHERRTEIAAEAAKSAIHCINQFNERRRFTLARRAT